MKARMMISATGNDGSVSARPNRHTAKTVESFTLIEVLLAVVILGFGIVGIMRSYTIAARALSFSTAKIEALCLAKETYARLEQPALPDTVLQPGVYYQTVTGSLIPGSKWVIQTTVKDERNCLQVTVEAARKRKSSPGGVCLYGYLAP